MHNPYLLIYAYIHPSAHIYVHVWCVFIYICIYYIYINLHLHTYIYVNSCLYIRCIFISTHTLHAYSLISTIILAWLASICRSQQSYLRDPATNVTNAPNLVHIFHRKYLAKPSLLLLTTCITCHFKRGIVSWLWPCKRSINEAISASYILIDFIWYFPRCRVLD
jgi:hypothetical protein